MKFLWFCLLGTFFLRTPESPAQGGPEDAPPNYGGVPMRRAEAETLDAQHRKVHGEDADVLVLPGLIADRRTKRVEILAETTELEKEAILEFLVIDQTCGRGYEALLWSFAKPSAVHRALEFIGMNAGEPYHPDALRFWPKGEHLKILVQPTADTEAVRLESWILDRSTGKALEASTFLFTGSYRLPQEAPAHGGAYAVDVFEPKSIVSIFNTRLTVIDVPTRSSERDIYGRLVLHPEAAFKPHQLVTLILTPEEGKRLRDLKLAFRKSEEAPVVLSELASGKELVTGPMVETLATFGTLTEAGEDLFVQLDFAPDLSLKDAQTYARLIKTIDTESGIRAEPPLEGQLFYEAFSPRPSMLDRKKRFVHPWELELAQDDDGGLTGTLCLYHFDKEDETLVYSTWPVSTPQVLAESMEAENARREAADAFAVPPAMLVYADPEMPYGAVTRFISKAFPEGRGTLFLFLQEMAETPGAEPAVVATER